MIARLVDTEMNRNVMRSLISCLCVGWRKQVFLLVLFVFGHLDYRQFGIGSKKCTLVHP